MGRAEKEKMYHEWIRLYESGKSTKEIGNLFSVSHQRVGYVLLHNYNIKMRPKKREKQEGFLECFRIEIEQRRMNGEKTVSLIRNLGFYYQHLYYKDLAKFIETIPLYGNINNRKCTICGFVGDKSMFQKHTKKEGWRNVCRSKYTKKYREENKARMMIK